MTFLKSDSRSHERAASLLAEGRVCVLPTDTVYGLSGVVDFAGSVRYDTARRIQQIKGRAVAKPLIILLDSPDAISDYAGCCVPPHLLGKWPGPLTLIVPLRAGCPLVSSAGTAAFRCPGDPWLRSVIRSCGRPVYSTSANQSGSPILERESDIVRMFSGVCDFIVCDGDRPGGVPSTIVSVLEGRESVLRQGAVVV